jgi:hypothetical protein
MCEPNTACVQRADTFCADQVPHRVMMAVHHLTLYLPLQYVPVLRSHWLLYQLFVYHYGTTEDHEK